MGSFAALSARRGRRDRVLITESSDFEAIAELKCPQNPQIFKSSNPHTDDTELHREFTEIHRALSRSAHENDLAFTSGLCMVSSLAV